MKSDDANATIEGGPPDGELPVSGQSTGLMYRTVPRRRALHGLIVLAGVLTLNGCTNDIIGSSRSSSLLVVERIGAARGGTTDQPINTFLESDPLTCDDATPPSCSIFADTARVTTRLGFKDPGTAENPASPTSANFVTINRVRVEYVRNDGRNDPGVDVPHPYETGGTFTTVSGIQTGEFTLVPITAKLEPPLRNLIGLGGQVAINVVAEITFFGHDQTGAEVVARGTIGITFADFGP